MGNETTTTNEKNTNPWWTIVGFYKDDGAPFVEHVRAPDEISAVMEFLYPFPEDQRDLPQVIAVFQGIQYANAIIPVRVSAAGTEPEVPPRLTGETNLWGEAPIEGLLAELRSMESDSTASPTPPPKE